MKTKQYIDISQFLKKLYRVVEDPQTDHVISWDDSGESFVIHNVNTFTTEIIPELFKMK